MKIKSLSIFLALGLGFSFNSFSQNIKVRIFSDQTITQATIRSSFGKYSLSLDNNSPITITKTSKVDIKSKDQKVEVKINDSLYGCFNNIVFNKEGLRSFFQIETNIKSLTRRYDDNLIVNSDNKELRLINNIETENYIAGVVQAETWGATKNVDFFKIQAICVRNYIMMNIAKHKKDGYQLCDAVHCQAYKGRANQPEVIEGAYNSKGEIIVDINGNIIETLFHSNSGGQTVSSEDVWGKPFSHLVGKIDSFSVGLKAYAWEKYIPLKDWQRYFKEKGVNVKDDSIKNELLNFSQNEGRKKEMLGVSLVQIRKDFNLRSTFFSCQEWGSEVKLNGKGYGHGVGLSQEGAIKMCDEGFEYWQVIEHYYTGAKIKRIDEDKLLGEN